MIEDGKISANVRMNEKDSWYCFLSYVNYGYNIRNFTDII